MASSKQSPLKTDKFNVNNKFVDKSKQLRSSDADEPAEISDQEALRHLTLGFASLWAKHGEKSTERKLPYACDLYLLAKKHTASHQKSDADI